MAGGTPQAFKKWHIAEALVLNHYHFGGNVLPLAISQLSEAF